MTHLCTLESTSLHFAPATGRSSQTVQSAESVGTQLCGRGAKFSAARRSRTGNDARICRVNPTSRATEENSMPELDVGKLLADAFAEVRRRGLDPREKKNSEAVASISMEIIQA